MDNMDASAKKWLPGFFMLLVGVALRALDWISKADTLASLFNRLPSWMRFLGNPMIDLLFIIGGFLLLLWATREKLPTGPSLVGPRGEVLSSVRVSKRKLVIIAGVAVITGVFLAFGIWATLSRHSVTASPVGTAQSDSVPELSQTVEQQESNTENSKPLEKAKPSEKQTVSIINRQPHNETAQPSKPSEEEKSQPQELKSSEGESAPSQEPPLPPERIRAFSKQISSDDEKFPYALEVTIQTNVPISPTRFLIEFSGPIGKANYGFYGMGVFTNVTERRQGNTYFFSFDGPIFRPESPIGVWVYSTTQVKMVSITRLR